jgi:hypothetical protein
MTRHSYNARIWATRPGTSCQSLDADGDHIGVLPIRHKIDAHLAHTGQTLRHRNIHLIEPLVLPLRAGKLDRKLLTRNIGLQGSSAAANPAPFPLAEYRPGKLDAIVSDPVSTVPLVRLSGISVHAPLRLLF